MKNIYIVFDKLHSNEAGGLVSAYASLIQLLKEEYTIKVVSIINSNITRHEMFTECEIINVSKYDFFPRMEVIADSIKHFKLFSFIKELFKLICYFCYIPFARTKMKKMFIAGDIIIVSSPAAGMFMSSKNRFILEIHSKFEYFWGNNKLGTLQRKLMTKPELAIFRTKADAIKAKNLLNSTYIYNFFDDSCLKKKKSIGQKNREHKIIFMGRLVKSKNLPKLLDCAQLLKKKIPDFCLDIYGNGPLQEEVENRIRDYNLTNNVHLCGFTKDKNVYDDYAIQWITSDFEGFGLVIIEAKANGVPTISTNWGDGVYEVIHDQEDGFVEDSNEGIVNKTVELLNNKELLINISNHALTSFDEFSKKNAYIRWKEILSNFEGGIN